MLPGHGQERPRVARACSPRTSRLLADRCVDGITAEVEHARALAEGSPSIVTPLNRYLGYEAAAAVVKQAVKERRTIREVVIEQGHVAEGRLTEQQLDEALDVLSMTRPTTTDTDRTDAGRAGRDVRSTLTGGTG